MYVCKFKLKRKNLQIISQLYIVIFQITSISIIYWANGHRLGFCCIKLIANRLGTGALNAGKRPEHFRPRQGGIHGNPVSGNHPCKQLPTGTVTLN